MVVAGKTVQGVDGKINRLLEASPFIVGASKFSWGLNKVCRSRAQLHLCGLSQAPSLQVQCQHSD